MKRVDAFPPRLPPLPGAVLAAAFVLAAWGLGIQQEGGTPGLLAGAVVLAVLAGWLAYRAAGAEVSPHRERLLGVLDALPWALLLTDEGEVLYANPAAHALLGVPPGSLAGQPLLHFVVPADRPALAAWLEQSRQPGVPPCQVHARREDGTACPVLVQGARVTYGGRQVLEVLFSDRTEARRAQVEAERLASFPRLNPDPILEIEDGGELVFANAAARRLLPGLAEQGAAHPYLRALPELWRQLRQGTPVAHAEAQVDGRIFEQTAILAPDEQSVRLYGRDVTERARIQRSLHVSEDRFARLFRLSPVAMGLSRLDDGTLLDVNESFARLLGYESPAQLIGQRTDDVLWENDEIRRRVASLLQRVRHVKPRLITIRTRTGERRHVIASAEVIEMDGVACASSMLIDAEEQQRLRQRVEEERDFALSVVETAGMGLVITDTDFKIRYVNRRLLDMTGYTEEETLGRDPALFIDPSDQPKVDLSREQRMMGGGEYVFETQVLCRDGSHLDVLVAQVARMEDGVLTGTTSVVIDVSAQRQAAREVERLRFFYENILHDLPLEVAVTDARGRFLFLNQASVHDAVLRQALVGRTAVDCARLQGLDPALYQRRQAWLESVIATRQDGRLEEVVEHPEHPEDTVVTLRVARPVLDARGEVSYVISYGIDISERKRSEVELIRARDRAEELSALKSSFIANMSHEVRTPLTAVIGFAEVLQEEIEAPELREVAILIWESGRRLLETLNSVLDLARMQAGALELRLEPSLLLPAVRTTVDLFRPLAERKGLVLSLDVADEGAQARVDLPAFNRIMNNLISNAIKFTDEGTVRVVLETSGAQVRVHVTDTGVGIEEAFIGRLFEEFQQESSGLSRSHPGSGLGLSIARRLAQLMRGTITVESRKHHGSVFTLCLPAWQEGAPAA